MKNKLIISLTALALLTGVQAATLSLDFGSAGTGTLLGPGHVGETTGALIPNTNTTWNDITAPDGSTIANVSSGLMDASGNALTGVSLDLGVGSASSIDWSNQPFARTGVSGARSGTGVFNNTTFRDFMAATNSNAAPSTVGLRVSGLASGDYRVWVMTRHTYINNDDVASDDYDIWVGGGDNTTAPNSLSTASVLQHSRNHPDANTASWAIGEGFTWAAIDVTLGSGQDLLVFSESTFDNQNGIMNAVQIAAIPEPGTLALVAIALGSLLFFRRRK